MNFSNKICLLCLEEHDSSLEIHGKQGTDLNIGTILQEHFWFVGTFATKNICENCWKKVESFHRFYNFVKSNHQRQLCETKTIIDNDSSIKEETIDIKEVFDVFTDYANTADSLASSDGWIEIDSDTTIGPTTIARDVRSYKSTILTYFDSADSLALGSDELKIDSGTTEGPATIARNTLSSNCTILASFDNGDSPAPRSNMLEIDSGTTEGPATLPHNTRNSKRTIFPSFDSSDSPTPIRDEFEADSIIIKGPATAVLKTRKYKRKSSTSPFRYKSDAHTERISQYFNMACDLCDTLLSSYRDAMKHYRDFHDIKQGYLICCKRKYINLKLMLSHCEWHMNPEAFKCEQCSKTFQDRHRLQRHNNLSHAPGIFNCNNCDKKFSQLNFLRTHQKQRHSQPFKCPICQKCFTGNIKLRCHIRDVHSLEDEREFRYNKRLLKKVGQVKNEAKQFECDICGCSFVFLFHLRNHISRVHVHHNLERDDRICEICAKPFSSEQTYKHHYITAHTTGLKKAQCDICGKWFQNKYRIYRHMRYHNSKTETCKVCGRVYSGQNSLSAHIRREHLQTSLWECIVCGRKLKNKQVLKEHMAMHAGITDLYTCTFCTKTFRSKANMYSHRKRAHLVELEEMKRKKEINNSTQF